MNTIFKFLIHNLIIWHNKRNKLCITHFNDIKWKCFLCFNNFLLSYETRVNLCPHLTNEPWFGILTASGVTHQNWIGSIMLESNNICIIIMFYFVSDYFQIFSVLVNVSIENDLVISSLKFIQGFSKICRIYIFLILTKIDF